MTVGLEKRRVCISRVPFLYMINTIIESEAGEQKKGSEKTARADASDCDGTGLALLATNFFVVIITTYHCASALTTPPFDAPLSPAAP